MMPLVTAENTPLLRGAPRPVAALPEGADFTAVLARLRAMMAPEQLQPAPNDAPVVAAPPEGEETGEEMPEASAPEPEVGGTPEIAVISQDSALGAFLDLPEGTATLADPADLASPTASPPASTPASPPGVPGRESLLRARLVLDVPGAAPFVARDTPAPVPSVAAGVAAGSLGTPAEAPTPDQPPLGVPAPDTRPADPPLTPRPLAAQPQASPQPPALADPLAPVSGGSTPEAGTGSAQPVPTRAPPGQSAPEATPPLLGPEGPPQPSRLGHAVAADAPGIAVQDRRSDQSRAPQAQPDLPGTAPPAARQAQAPLAGRGPTRLDQAQPGQSRPDAAQTDQPAPHRTHGHQAPPGPAQSGQRPALAAAAPTLARAPMPAPSASLQPAQPQAPVTGPALRRGTSTAAPAAGPTIMAPPPDPATQAETPQADARVPGPAPLPLRGQAFPAPRAVAAIPALPPGDTTAPAPEPRATALPQSAPRAEALPQAPAASRVVPGQEPVAATLRTPAPLPTPERAADPAPRPQSTDSAPVTPFVAPDRAPVSLRQPASAPGVPPPEGATPLPPPRASSPLPRDPYGPARAVFAAAEPPRTPAMAPALLPGQPVPAEAAAIARPPARSTNPDRPPPQASALGAAMPLPEGTPVPLAPPPGTAVPLPTGEQAADLVPRLDAPQRVEVMADPRPGATPPLDTPHRIAQQIAARLETGGPGSFDLALKPEELGHVRLKLVSHETGSLLIVHAERPETLDLMRRHIGALEQDLRALGHDQLSLRFSGGNAGGAGQQATPHTPPSQSASQGAPPADPRPQTQPAPAPTLRARDHLDLRL